LTLAGGAAIAKKVFVGTDLNYGGILSSTSQPFYQVTSSSGSAAVGTGSTVSLTNTFWNGSATSQGTNITYSAGVFTTTSAGVYVVFASGTWAASATAGRRNLTITASTGQIANSPAYSGTAGAIVVTVCGLFYMTANATIQASVFQDTGSSLNFTGTTAHAFSIFRLC
jgi:hypothetical protein